MGVVWVCLKMSCTPKNPMVLLIIIPFLNGYNKLGILTQHFQLPTHLVSIKVRPSLTVHSNNNLSINLVL